MTTANGGTIVVNIKGQDVGLSDLLARINQQMVQSTGTIKTYATVMNELDPTARKAESGLRSYSSALATLLAKQGDFAGAQKVLITALQGTSEGTSNSIRLQTQLATVMGQAEKAALKEADAQSTLAQATNSAGSAINNSTSSQGFSLSTLTQGLVSLRIGYQAVAGAAKLFSEVINSGNELERTLTTFKVLSGSQENYQKNLALARSEQARFGGSLNDTVDGMSNFANLANRTGVEIDKLTRLARALAIVDPAQGFKGAGIALKEFFSGDITSLARRFEIPRQVLNDLKNIKDPVEQFDKLTEALKRFGISTDLLDAQSKTVGTSFEKLKGNFEDFKASLGQLFGVMLQPVVETFATNIRQLADAVEQATNVFRNSAAAIQTHQNIFAKTDGYEAYRDKIAELNSQLPLLAPKLQDLTESQYAYAQSLVKTGTDQGAAIVAAQNYAATFDAIQKAAGDLVETQGRSEETARSFAVALGETAAISDNARGFVEGLAQAVSDGLPVEQAMIALTQFKAAALREVAVAQAAAAAATDQGTNATQLFTTALSEEAAQKLIDQTATDALKIRQEELMAAATAAAGGLGNAGAAAVAMANQFGIAISQANQLVLALAQIQRAKNAEALGISGVSTSQQNQLFNVDAATAATGYREELTKISKAQEAYNFAVANTAGKLQIANRELNNTVKGSEAYYNALQKRDLLEKQLEAEKKKGSGAPKLTPNEKINTKLLDDLDKYNNKFEDAEQKHYDKLADIYDDYAKKQAEQIAKNEVSKRRSRADFYTGLSDAKGIDTSAFAAQYEEAFQKAQEIAQSGKAKLANEFLDLRQKQIEEMKKLAEEEAQIKEDRKSGKLDKKTAEEELAYLEGRKKLIQDAQDEEQKQLLAAGDDNQNRLQEQLDNENKAYQDQTDKIATASERAADAKIKHAERSKIAVSEENKELAAQAAYYDRIAAKNGGQVPVKARTASNAETPTIPADSTTTKPVNVEQTKPITVDTTSDALVVRQADLFIVQDVDVYNIISDVGVRLETRLGQVIESINAARDSISNAVKNVESAVGRIKVNSQSVLNG
jgi:hypothetical protein